MGRGAQQPSAQYAPPPPAEYNEQGPSGRSLTARGQLRQQMFSSTPSGLTNSGHGTQDQGGSGGGHLGQEAPASFNNQPSGTSSPFGGKPSTPLSPFGAQSTGASTPPFGAQPPGAGTTPPFGAQPPSAGTTPPFGAQPPGAGTTPPFGAQPSGTAPPFGARPPGAGTTPPFGAQPSGTAPPFGARPPGAGTTPPFGAQPSGTAPPFGARPPGAGTTPPFGGPPQGTGAPPAFGAPSTAVAQTPNFASPPQSGANFASHGAAGDSGTTPFGAPHPTAQGGSGPFGGPGVPFTNAPSKGFAGPRGQRTLGEPQGLSNSPGINLPSGFTGPPGAAPHPQEGYPSPQGQMQMQGEGQQGAFPTFGGAPIPAGELDAEDQPNYHRLQRGPGEEGRFYEEGYEPPDLPDLTLTQDPRLWAPIDVPTTPRAKQKAYRTLETSRQLNRELAQPSLRKTNFHGDHYDPIDPDELDPIKGALQQRNVRRRHNAPEEYENEIFAWSVSGWSIAHTEDRLRSLRNVTWIPECYISREGVDDIYQACINSGRRALLVVGEEGSGKTSLISKWVHQLIENIRFRAQNDPIDPHQSLHNYEGDIVVFLHGRSDYQGPTSLSAEALLCEIIARKTYVEQRFDQVSHLIDRLLREVLTPDPIKPFYARPSHLRHMRQRINRRVWIVLDGIDESDRFNELIKVIDENLNFFTQSPHIQLVMSMRWRSYQMLSRRQMGEGPSKADAFMNARHFFNPDDLTPDGYELDPLTDFRENFPGIFVRPFREEELKEAYLLRQRQRPARACSMSFDRIQMPLTELMRVPQMLNLYHDVFKGREHAPVKLNQGAVYDAYIRGLGRHFPNAVSWIHKIAVQMYEAHSSMIDPEATDGGRKIPLDKIASNTGALITVMRPNDEGEGMSLVGYSFATPGLYEHLIYLHLKNQIAPRPRPNGDDMRHWATQVIDPMGVELGPLLDALTLLALELVEEGDEAPLVAILEVPHRLVRNHILVNAIRRLGFRNQGTESGRKTIRRFMEAWSEHALQSGLESAFLEPVADALRQLTDASVHESAALIATHADQVVQSLIKVEPDEPTYRKFLSQFMRVRGTIDQISGRIPDAIESLEKALESEQRLAKSEPSVRHLKQLSESLAKIGLLHQEVGDMEQALVCFRYTSVIDETLATELPSLQHQIAYIESLNRLGILHQELEDFEGALDDFLQAVRFGRQSLAKRPTNRLRELISQSMQRAGAIHQHLEEMDEALKCFRESIDLEQSMVEADPSVDRLRMLCMTLNYLGSLYRMIEDYENSFKIFHKSKSLFDTLQKDDDRFECREEICDTLNQIGELHGDLGELEEALDFFEKVLDLHKLTVKEDPIPDARKELSAALVKVGDIHQALDHYDEALDYFQQSLEVSRALMEQHPNITHRRNWVFTLCRIAEIYKIFGQLEDSLHLFERAQNTYQNLIVEQPTVLHRKELSITLGQLGDLYQYFKRPEQALDCFQRGLTLNEEILQEEPYLDHQRDLSVLYLKVGDLHQETDRAGLAIGFFQKALEFQRELVELDPIPLHRRELYLTLSRIGEMYHAFHQYDSALASYHAAMEINQELIDEIATSNRRHEQAVLHIKAGDVYKEGKRYEEGLEHYHFALKVYEELIQEAPIPIHHRGLQTTFSRINALRLDQQRLTAIPASPEIMQEYYEQRGGGDLGQNALRTPTLDYLHSGEGGDGYQ